MIKLGIIGTSMITDAFLRAAQATQHYQLNAVYSRRQETAQAFAKKYDPAISCYTDLAAFVASPLDVIYIASPNSLHYQQAKLALLAGKHVIIEKPMVSTPQELEALYTIAAEQQRFIFEAARNYHEPAMAAIKAWLADKNILGAHLTYAKYSSKMPQLLAGQTPNVFSDQLSGGALMDLGIYCLYAAIAWFGRPGKAYYKAQQLANTVDLNGTGSLDYGDFLVTLTTGKNLTSHLPSEIYLSEGTLVLDGINAIRSAIFHQHDGSQTPLTFPTTEDLMQDEAEAFAQVMLAPHALEQLAQYEKWTHDTKAVHHTLYQMRLDANIIFKADQPYEKPTS